MRHIIRHYSSTFKSARNDRIRTVSVQTTSRIIAGLVYKETRTSETVNVNSDEIS